MILRGRRKQIDEIMDLFDFRKVSIAMQALDWEWISTDGVPEERNLRKKARSLLEMVVKEKYNYIESGGLVAEKLEDGSLSLSFVVDQWTAEYE